MTGALVANSSRSPSGMHALGGFLHWRGLTFGHYTAEARTTCGHYPASMEHEEVDAQTFASWGVDFLKVDGCNRTSADYYSTGYPRMGAALEASGRQIEYSCSWPAYAGDNETAKPFAEYIMGGCNLWRNWWDMQCRWSVVSDIIDHWGDFSLDMAPYAGPGHWHDMDMILVGNDCLTPNEERTQMSLWSVLASPLIMGNDLRKISEDALEILMNRDMVAVSQDPLGQMGIRLPQFTSESRTSIWARNLATGDVAIVLCNKGTENATCTDEWKASEGGYLDACRPGTNYPAAEPTAFSGLTLDDAQHICCANSTCAGFNYNAIDGSGNFSSVQGCGWVRSQTVIGYTKVLTPPTSTDITIRFADVNLLGRVHVYDIWERKLMGSFEDEYTAPSVPGHGVAFLRLSASQPIVA